MIDDNNELTNDLYQIDNIQKPTIRCKCKNDIYSDFLIQCSSCQYLSHGQCYDFDPSFNLNNWKCYICQENEDTNNELADLYGTEYSNQESNSKSNHKNNRHKRRYGEELNNNQNKNSEKPLNREEKKLRRIVEAFRLLEEQEINKKKGNHKPSSPLINKRSHSSNLQGNSNQNSSSKSSSQHSDWSKSQSHSQNPTNSYNSRISNPSLLSYNYADLVPFYYGKKYFLFNKNRIEKQTQEAVQQENLLFSRKTRFNSFY